MVKIRVTPIHRAFNFCTESGDFKFKHKYFHQSHDNPQTKNHILWNLRESIPTKDVAMQLYLENHILATESFFFKRSLRHPYKYAEGNYNIDHSFCPCASPWPSVIGEKPYRRSLCFPEIIFLLYSVDETQESFSLRRPSVLFTITIAFFLICFRCDPTMSGRPLVDHMMFHRKPSYVLL